MQAAKYITFQISGKYFALPADRIREMMPMQPLAPWPAAFEAAANAPCVLGAVQSRGRLVPILDLRARLRLKARAGGRRRETLLIVASRGGLEFGFAADQVTDIIHVRPDERRGCSIAGHGRIRTVVDIDQIVDQARQPLAAAFSSSSLSSG